LLLGAGQEGRKRHQRFAAFALLTVLPQCYIWPTVYIVKSSEQFAMITPAQILGARGMLGMTRAELARRAGIASTTLHNIEKGGADAHASTLEAVRKVLEKAGVEFFDDGVKLKAPGKKGRGP
jgi:DNA-binding XRE family transcriptional regulator